MVVKHPIRMKHIAPCGMNCAICTAHLREKKRCEGCHSPERIERRQCAIFSCEHVRGRCGPPCADYPCKRVRLMDKRYRTRYHMSVIRNLEEIRDHGIRQFVTNERERWTCRTCGGVIDVHQGRCASCGKEREASGCDKEE